MAKKVIKEMIIILLLCLAIILVLGLILYEYVPTSKIIPEEVSYTTPSEIKEEINKGENVEDEQVILTYSVDSTDLRNYERINTYVPGKTNPFSSYDTSSNQGNNTTAMVVKILEMEIQIIQIQEIPIQTVQQVEHIYQIKEQNN